MKLNVMALTCLFTSHTELSTKELSKLETVIVA